MTPTAVASLPHLGVLRFSGADTLRFLQGQLSNDVERLPASGSLLAGLHSPQGRVIAVLLLLAGADGTVLAVLPQELAAAVSTRLARFILRAKVRIEDASAQLAVFGVEDPAGRRLLVQPRDAPAPAGESMPQSAWRAGDIALGLPQVYVATSEAFLAQMLNLDRVDGVSFTKGCYTGQEIIARAHYRGRVKRRMQRFLAPDAAAIAPGERYRLPDGRTIEVVDAAPRRAGGWELLAVAPLTVGPSGEDALEDPAAPCLLGAQSAPLPYALED